MSDASMGSSPANRAVHRIQAVFTDSELYSAARSGAAVISSEPVAAAGCLQKLSAGEAMLSVIIPLLNEAESIPELYLRLKGTLNTIAPSHELIFVDDGSTDGSFGRLKQLWEEDPAVAVLRFRRNFGKSAALASGFDRARGDVVAMMDADLQDQPEELPKLIETLDSGYDLVTGWKQQRRDPLSKTIPSRLFNAVVSRQFKIAIHDFNCGLKVMRSDVANELRLYGELHRFIPVLAASKGFRVGERAVSHAARKNGISKYGAKRLIAGTFDFITTILLTRYVQKPLHLFGALGLLSALAALFSTALGAGEQVSGHGAIAVALWLLALCLALGCCQLFCAGLIAELVAHGAYHETARYAVAEQLKARSESPR